MTLQPFLPIKLSLSTCVNLLPRNGTCVMASPKAKARMTSLSADKDVLISTFQPGRTTGRDGIRTTFAAGQINKDQMRVFLGLCRQSRFVSTTVHMTPTAPIATRRTRGQLLTLQMQLQYGMGLTAVCIPRGTTCSSMRSTLHNQPMTSSAKTECLVKPGKHICPL